MAKDETKVTDRNKIILNLVAHEIYFSFILGTMGSQCQALAEQWHDEICIFKLRNRLGK